MAEPAHPVIAVKGLRKEYPTSSRGTVLALEDIDFDVAEGEFVALVGPSGCGKSTLLRIVAGLLPATSGQVRLRNVPVTGPRRDIGVVFQSPVLFPWRTVLENVLLPVDVQRLGRAKNRDRALELLAPEFREIIILRELQGLSYKEISDVAGVPVGTVMSRLSRARAHLQRALRKED